MAEHRSRKPGVESSILSVAFAARAALAQLGERQTEDLKVPGSIPGGGILRVMGTKQAPVA